MPVFRSNYRWGALVPVAVLFVLAGGCAIHPRGECGPACADIRAAETIEFPSDRLVVLHEIATRENLSEHEQVYLVNAICVFGFSNDQADALITLINNPCCTATVRKYIVDHLPWCGLGTHKKRVIQALAARTDEEPPPQ